MLTIEMKVKKLFLSSCHFDGMLSGLGCALFDFYHTCHCNFYDQSWSPLKTFPWSLTYGPQAMEIKFEKSTKINFLVFKSKYLINCIDYFNLTNIDLQMNSLSMNKTDLNSHPVNDALLFRFYLQMLMK